MDDHAGPGHAHTLVKDRHDDGRVHGVQGAIPRIAGHEGVAVVDIVAEDLDDLLDDDVQRGGLTHDEHPGVEALAVRCQDGHVEVAGFIDRR